MSLAIRELPLIMDVGMNNGRDSLFYLQKGFRVVAIEANPILAANGRRKMAEYIESGQLVIEEIGLAEKAGQLPFYANLENDHWSSLNKDWGTRQGTKYKEILVDCIPPQALFEKHGIPYFLKVDIEGNDLVVVRALNDFSKRPRYVSVEEGGASFFAELWAIGCRQFKIVDQRLLHKVRCPTIPLEGKHVDATFDGETSGPFGEEAPGIWQSFDLAIERFVTQIRSPTRGYIGPQHSWFDIHGKIE